MEEAQESERLGGIGEPCYKKCDVMDYKTEVRKARKALDPLVREIKGLCFMGFSLENTAILSKYYVEHIDVLGYETRLAFTKAIIVDYGRLWKGNKN